MFKVVLAAALLAASAPVTGTVAQAESLSEAMVESYSTNPALRAERARQRSTDELVSQAMAGWKPTVQASAEVAYRIDDNDNSPGNVLSQGQNVPRESIPAGINIQLVQPLFNGFKTVEGTAQAEANVLAGRQNLLIVEQQTLFQTVQAYMNVVRDRRIIELRKKNVQVLRTQLAGARERFAVGEVTKTDVEQSRARLSAAEAQLSDAKASLAASVANYLRVVGHAPGTLRYPKLVRVPRSLDEALTAAGRTNPNILSAAYVEEASRHNVEVVRGDLLPEIVLNASATERITDLGENPGQETQELRVGGQITVPLYDGGRTYSAVRQAKQIASQRRLQVLETGRSVNEAVSQSWSSLQSSYQTITSARALVEASALALEGVRQEYLVGSRTTLDVLNAESELVNSQIQLVNEQRDQIILSYQLLGSIGNLTARHLRLSVKIYDPKPNYRAAKKKWIDTTADTIE
jgi:outer membrane protein